MSTRLLHGDCREVLKTLPSESVHCVVTSPPYYALRDYQVAGQIGLEATPDAYVAEIVAVFREVRRVLRNDGTLWLNLGDSYSNAGTRQGDRDGITETVNGHRMVGNGYRPRVDGLKNKDLIGIPWMVAFALRADGWILRQDIIWSKPNPMPESVRDRCTKAHEYLFLLSKSPRYFYDAEAIAEEAQPSTNERDQYRRTGYAKETIRDGKVNYLDPSKAFVDCGGKRNKRSVWEVATAPFSEAHFATFPPALIEPCILAGCPAKACAKCGKPWVRETERTFIPQQDVSLEKGIKGAGNQKPMDASNGWQGVPRGSTQYTTLGFSPSCSCNAATVPGTCLDPFAGAGTTGLVADRLGRNAVLIELNADYADMSHRRIVDDAPLFAEVVA